MLSPRDIRAATRNLKKDEITAAYALLKLKHSTPLPAYSIMTRSKGAAALTPS
jgi:hypothetical protein